MLFNFGFDLLYNSFYSSCMSTFHLIYMVGLGILARYLKFTDEKIEKALSKIITNMILPAFIFSDLITTFKISNYIILLEILGGSLIIYILTLVIVFVTGLIMKLKLNHIKFLCGVFSSAQTTSFPIILVEVIYPVLEEISNIVPEDPKMTAKNRGMLYIGLLTIFANIWRWTVSYNLINEEEDRKEDQLLLETVEDGVKKPENKINIFWQIFNMPIFSAILGIVICCIPPVQDYFNTEGSLINKSIVSVNKVVANSWSFLIMFLLGLNIAGILFKMQKKTNMEGVVDIERENVNPVIFSKAQLAILTCLKLIIMPILLSPVIVLIFTYWLYTDNVLTFLLLYITSAPVAICTLVLCTQKQAFVSTISMMMIVFYFSAIIPLTFEVAGFLYGLGYLKEIHE